jgi:aminomethyltransferase
MSTNDVAELRPGEARQTVLTTAIAQIVDVVTLLAREADTVLLASPGRGGRVREWLGRYIFFQDDVRLSATMEGWAHWGVYGPGATREAGRVAPFDPLSPGETVAWEGGVAWWVEAPAGGGVRLLLEPRLGAEAERRWGVPGEVASQAYEILRIEAGLPEIGSEVLEDSLPLEVGLRSGVSFTKGCYIGQEIIARMDSRGRLAKELLGLRGVGAFRAGDGIRQAGREVGKVTSAASSPRLGFIALASVRPAALGQSGGEVEVGEESVRGKLRRLPFEAGEPSRG